MHIPNRVEESWSKRVHRRDFQENRDSEGITPCGIKTPQEQEYQASPRKDPEKAAAKGGASRGGWGGTAEEWQDSHASQGGQECAGPVQLTSPQGTSRVLLFPSPWRCQDTVALQGQWVGTKVEEE